MFTELNLIQPSHFMDGEIGIQGSHTATEAGSVSKFISSGSKFSPLANLLTVMHTMDAQPVLMVDNSILYYTVEQIPGPWLQFYLCKMLRFI